MLQKVEAPEAATRLPEWLAAARERTRGLKVGGKLIYRAVTASTNDDVRALALQGAPDGLVVLADEQTHGRGRLGRAWVAPAGDCLLLSVLYRCTIPLTQAAQLGMLTTLSALEAIEGLTGIRAELKWPNDILLQGRKAGGILMELDSAGDRLRWAVVGLGLNVNADFSGLPEIAGSAISLKEMAGASLDRGELLALLLLALSRRYARFLQGASPFAEWQSRLGTLGRQVVAQVGEEVLSGLAEFVVPEGTLFLRLEDGSRRELFAGDVRLGEAGS
jgi:BirA family biotin operon repressor/biotin-[acetyl-CoA-carboxylase] ligase